MIFQNTLEFAQQADVTRAFSSYRSQFHLPQHKGKDAIYFLGNSLGLQPKRTGAAISEVLSQWGHLGVEGFFKGDQPWLEAHRHIQPALAAVVGAQPSEVVAMNQLTVNLHLMLVSFYKLIGNRTKIICEAKAFPSDQYMLYTHVRHRGLDPDETIIVVSPREGEVLIQEEDILAAIDEHRDRLALVFWGGVNYYTGQVFQMETISRAARDAGAVVGFDLAHAVGNIPLKLHDWNVDFACWCSYKYLNSGPGGIGGAYVHKRFHNDMNLDRFAGWWGNKRETQFLMEKDFVPEPSAEGWQLSTPSPFLYASHKAALDIITEIGVENVWRQNKELNNYLWYLLSDITKDVPEGALEIITPTDEKERGCQVSLRVRNGKRIFDQLSQEGLFADWREPDVIRVAPVALYNTFEEVWQFTQILKQALHTFAA